jgi:competence protein ComEC
MISRRVNFIGTILATIIFIILTGASASVIRAGILAILIIFAKYIGRRPYYPIMILIVADLMLIFNPYALKNDLGFQLSFLAFTGLLIISTPISQNKYLQFIPENWRKILAETLGAQILVLPILVYNFGIVSIIAPLANILILPTIPATMLSGFLIGIAGMIYFKLGELFAIFSWLILKYILVVVENLSKISWAAFTFKTQSWWWIPIYYLLMVLIFMRSKPVDNPSGNKEN